VLEIAVIPIKCEGSHEEGRTAVPLYASDRVNTLLKGRKVPCNKWVELMLFLTFLSRCLWTGYKHGVGSSMYISFTMSMERL
jgi:hypothetical protein